MGGKMEGLDERGCEEKDTGTRWAIVWISQQQETPQCHTVHQLPRTRVDLIRQTPTSLLGHMSVTIRAGPLHMVCHVQTIHTVCRGHLFLIFKTPAPDHTFLHFSLMIDRKYPSTHLTSLSTGPLISSLPHSSLLSPLVYLQAQQFVQGSCPSCKEPLEGSLGMMKWIKWSGA